MTESDEILCDSIVIMSAYSYSRRQCLGSFGLQLGLNESHACEMVFVSVLSSVSDDGPSAMIAGVQALKFFSSNAIYSSYSTASMSGVRTADLQFPKACILLSLAVL